MESLSQLVYWTTDIIGQNGDLVMSILTLFLVYYSARSVRMSGKILKHTTQPTLHPIITYKGDRNRLIIENHSAYPAYDLDIWVFSHFNNYDTPYKKLLHEPESVDIDFSRTLFRDNENYAITERITHYSFPPKSSCEIPLYSPSSQTVTLIMQFRDATRQNYLYEYFMALGFSDKPPLQMTSGGKGLIEIPRIHYFKHQSLGELWAYLRPEDEEDAIGFWYRFKIVVSQILRDMWDRVLIYRYMDKNSRDTFLREFPQVMLKEVPPIFWEGLGRFRKLD